MKLSLSARSSSLATLVAFAVLLHAMPGRATTYNVATSTGLVNAIAAASAAANLGPDTINIAPGHYFLGQQYIFDDLTLNGGGRPGTVLESDGTGGPAFNIFSIVAPNYARNDNILATFPLSFSGAF